MAYDLLTDPLLTVGVHLRTLPEVLHLLATSDEVNWDAVPVHEQEPWHATLVQLAALAVLRVPGRRLGQVATSAEFWREELLVLADGVEEAFHLVVDDLRKPAFLQPPTADLWSAFKRGAPYPDTISTLRAAKGHDVKRLAQGAARPEHWATATNALQTTGGHLGAGRDGSARMQHGGACRLTCVLIHDESPGVRFRDEVNRLVTRHDEMAARYGMPVVGGLPLLWLHPWDGTLTSKHNHSLPKSLLDPLAVEVCSRVRLREEGGQIVPYTTTSYGPRVDKDVRGRIGDPFGLENEDGTLATIGQSGWFPADVGWSYEKLIDILFGGFVPGIGFAPTPDEPSAPMLLYCSGMPSVQHRAYRLLRQVLPVPAGLAAALFDTTAATLREKIGQRARHMADLVVVVQDNALVPALRVALYPQSPWGSGAEPYRIRHDWMLGRALFAQLWEDRDVPDDVAVARWLDTVERIGTARLDTALRNCTWSTAERVKAVAKATDRWMYGVADIKATISLTTAAAA